MASSLAEQRDAASTREQLAAQLCRAMFNGDMERALNALQQGADPNLANREGHLPLWLCCGRGHADLARLLLEHNANVNASRPFLGAATREVVTGITPLFPASGGHHEACVRILLDARAAVNHKCGDGDTPLIFAVQSLANGDPAKRLRVIEMLVSAHADLTLQDASGATPLDMAKKCGFPDAARLLVAGLSDADAAAAVDEAHARSMTMGASRHAAAELHRRTMDEASAKGMVPSMAVTLGWDGVVHQWLRNGGDVNQQLAVDEKRHGCTMLFGACSHARERVVETLLKAAADVNLQDSQGYTALMAASSNAHFGKEDVRVPIVRQLLDAKADTTLCDDNGDSALNFAEKEGFAQIAALLREPADKRQKEHDRIQKILHKEPSGQEPPELPHYIRQRDMWFQSNYQTRLMSYCMVGDGKGCVISGRNMMSGSLLLEQLRYPAQDNLGEHMVELAKKLSDDASFAKEALHNGLLTVLSTYLNVDWAKLSICEARAPKRGGTAALIKASVQTTFRLSLLARLSRTVGLPFPLNLPIASEPLTIEELSVRSVSDLRWMLETAGSRASNVSKFSTKEELATHVLDLFTTSRNARNHVQRLQQRLVADCREHNSDAQEARFQQYVNSPEADELPQLVAQAQLALAILFEAVRYKSVCEALLTGKGLALLDVILAIPTDGLLASALVAHSGQSSDHDVWNMAQFEQSRVDLVGRLLVGLGGVSARLAAKHVMQSALLANIKCVAQMADEQRALCSQFCDAKKGLPRMIHPPQPYRFASVVPTDFQYLSNVDSEARLRLLLAATIRGQKREWCVTFRSDHLEKLADRLSDVHLALTKLEMAERHAADPSATQARRQAFKASIMNQDGFSQNEDAIDELIARMPNFENLAKETVFNSRRRTESVLSALRCVVCGAHGANTTLRRCSRCRTSYYCSTECQKQDWPTHKLECVKVKDKAEKK